MMHAKITILVTIITLIFAITTGSLGLAWADSDKDYCYDQVGDGHFCFDTKEKCRHEEKHDDIAESHCYNKDRN
jgi:hypothetical protein